MESLRRVVYPSGQGGKLIGAIGLRGDRSQDEVACKVGAATIK